MEMSLRAEERFSRAVAIDITANTHIARDVSEGLGALLFAGLLTLTSLFKIAVLLIDHRFGDLGPTFDRYAGTPAMILLLLGPMLAGLAVASGAWAAYRARVSSIREAGLHVLMAAFVFEVIAQVWFRSIL